MTIQSQVADITKIKRMNILINNASNNVYSDMLFEMTVGMHLIGSVSMRYG